MTSIPDPADLVCLWFMPDSGARSKILIVMGLSKERYLQLQEKFLTVRSFKHVAQCELLHFDAYEIEMSDSFSIRHMCVVEETKAGVNELLNWINQFAVSIRNVSAWAQVLDDIEEREERFAAIYEIVTPVAFLTLAFPAAIRGKLTYVAGKMVRDTFKVTRNNGKDIEDYQLVERELGTFASHVARIGLIAEWDSFVASLQEIDGDGFRSATSNYRNRENHQITPNLEIGERMAFGPLSGDGFEGFTFGVERAISLRTLVTPLVEQQVLCSRAFKTFWPIVRGFADYWKRVST